MELSTSFVPCLLDNLPESPDDKPFFDLMWNPGCDGVLKTVDQGQSPSHASEVSDTSMASIDEVSYDLEQLCEQPATGLFKESPTNVDRDANDNTENQSNFMQQLVEGNQDEELLNYLLDGTDFACTASTENSTISLIKDEDVDLLSDESETHGEQYGFNPIQPAPATVCTASNLPTSSPQTRSSTRTKARTVTIVRPGQVPSREQVDKSNLEEDKSRKNAIQARINRQKKKAYINGLEGKVDTLTTENESLKRESKKLTKEKVALEEEVAYLKNVLANESTLSGLLQNIGNVNSVSLSSSFITNRKRAASAEHDHDYPKSSKVAKKAKPSGGICLHVDKNKVSLEFCPKCACMANSADGGDGK